MTTKRTWVIEGEKYKVVLPCSEVCLSMKVANKIGEIMLISKKIFGFKHYSAQIFMDGKPFSFPVGTGEAGFYRDLELGFYTYIVTEEPELRTMEEIQEESCVEIQKKLEKYIVPPMMENLSKEGKK